MKAARKHSAGLLFGMLAAGSSVAAVSAEEAKQLGGATLTEFGAERAGNKDGTIPAYEAAIIKSPTGWDRKKQGYPDPWSEKPIFSISAQNAAQHADKLDAMVDLFKRYPNFRMDVYPSHRTMVYPKYVLDNTVKNATSCKGIQDDLKLEGCYGGLPFPIPKSGRQVIWNHLMMYTAPNLQSDGIQTFVTSPSGKAVLQSNFINPQQYPMYQPDKAGVAFASDALYFRTVADFQGPARQVGTKLLLVYSLDTLGIGARVWQYVPGQRRVKLAPDLAYDTPAPSSGGSATMDEQQGFMGATDRYDFKLIGKKEKYIAYNSFKMTDPRVCPDVKVAANPNFALPECLRFELHRVWKLEATLKPGFRHIYPKRVLYWDEDTYAGGATENYDSSGKLYRTGSAIPFPLFDVGGMSGSSWVVMDIVTGLWTLQGGMGSEGAAWYATKARPDVYYSPEVLAGEGIR